MKSSIPYLLNAFLYKIGIQIDTIRIAEVYDRHPLQHSIRALSDTLDELNVSNAVCHLEFEQLFQIEGPFVVAAGLDEYPFCIVEKFDNKTQAISLLSVVGKQAILTFEQFRSIWNGTVLLAEKGEETHEDSLCIYWIKQGLWHLNRTIDWWILGLIACLLVWGVMQSPTPAVWRYVIKVIGVAVSLVAVRKASFSPQLVQRFCHQGQNSDCNEVFRSNGAKFFGWISLGELSLTYFATSIIWGVFFATNPASVFAVLDTVALLFVGYSFVWQIINHKWCPLCLVIDAVIILDLLTEIMLWRGFSPLFLPDILTFGILFVLGLLITRRVVTMAEKASFIPMLSYKYERLLESPDLFWELLYKQPLVATDNKDFDAVCNNIEAEHSITLVMNPSCSKCAGIHKALRAFQDYKINLIFVINEGDEQSRRAALMMISAGIQYGWEVADHIIQDWYESRIFPETLNIHHHAVEYLEQYHQYCEKNKVVGTPTAFIDNRYLPDLYDIEDLKILL